MTIPGTRFIPGEDFYTDWFPRGADNLIARAQLIDYVTASSVTVTITFYTKNEDNTADMNGTVVKDGGGTDYSLVLSSSDTNGDIKQIFIASLEATGKGLKEMVRLKVSTTGSGSLLGRIFAPIFYESATP